MSSMYIMNVCLVVLVIFLFFIYVYVDEHKETLFEGLQNEEDGTSDISGIAWKSMYSILTTGNSGTSYDDLIIEENNPFSSGDFKANLIQSEVEDDFKYFNNASAIFSGYSNKI